VNVTIQLTETDEMRPANIRVNCSSRLMGTDDVVVDVIEDTETHTA